MKSRTKLKLSLMSAASIAAFHMPQAIAQEEADSEALMDTITVVGVRGAQEASIDIKRASAEIVDSIVAEEIGKLPDITITDALQRVTGIQIDRAAGEGSTLGVRGSRSVMPTLNGERFITAEALLETNAAFQDVPASLVTGVNAYKSQSASQLDGATGGIIDIRTLRALTLDEGWTATGSVQARYGSITEDTDTILEGLVGYNWGRTAMSLSASYTDATNASPFQDVGSADPDYVDEFNTWVCNGMACGDLNGDGDDRDFYLTNIGWNSTVNNREFARERLGLAYNFNHELNDAWTMTADVVYNEMEELQNGQQVFVNGGFAGRSGFGPNNGSSIGGLVDADDYVGRWHPDGDVPIAWATDTTFNRSGFRAGVESVLRETEALNTNLQFDFDDGGAFTGSLRMVYSDAERDSAAVRAVGQTDALCIPQSEAQALASECTELNPGAISGSFQNRVVTGGDELFWSVDPALASLAADPAAWRLHSNWYEANVTTADQLVLRADGSYAFAEDMFSLDFGVRFSDRGATETRQDYFSPSGFDGLLNKFGEPGYALGQAGVTGGTAFGLTFDPLPAYEFTSSELAPYLTTVSDFNVNGLNLAIPMLNSEALIQDFTSFRDTLYGPGQFIIAPDRSYGVDEEQLAAYLQANFDVPVNDMLNVSGNVGLRVIDTTFSVTQNQVSGNQLRQDVLAGVDPNHTAYVDLGDIVTDTSRTVSLPSMNLNFDVYDNHRFKVAFQETQAQPRYEFLGRGEITFFNTEEPGEDFQRVSSIQRLGDPTLAPERARTFSIAWEWYPRDGTLISIGAFNTEFDRTIFQRNTQVAAADSDGVVRNGATLIELAEGIGASFEGLEFAYQSSFDYLPGLLANTGVTINYTYSPSREGFDAETGQSQFLAGGDPRPLNSTSEHQANFIAFYQDEKFQARVAANYVSEGFRGARGHWTYEQLRPTNLSSGSVVGIGQFSKEQLYVDVSASYDFNDHYQVFLNGSNITEEAPVDYRGSSDNTVLWNQFESIWSLGVRARF
ncbi:MAG: TonB-dependent receptor [Henriciella sp.]